MVAVRGIVKGNTVIIEDEDIREYGGTEAIVTLLNYRKSEKQKKQIDWDSFVIPSERGKHVEEYLVFPYRNHAQCYIDVFEKLIRELGIIITEIDKEIARKAAKIRAEYNTFKSMDTLQLAAAL